MLLSNGLTLLSQKLEAKDRGTFPTVRLEDGIRWDKKKTGVQEKVGASTMPSKPRFREWIPTWMASTWYWVYLLHATLITVDASGSEKTRALANDSVMVGCVYLAASSPTCAVRTQTIRGRRIPSRKSFERTEATTAAWPELALPHSATLLQSKYLAQRKPLSENHGGAVRSGRDRGRIA